MAAALKVQRVNLDIFEQNKDVTYKKGETFEVQATENLSTGYAWQYKIDPSKDCGEDAVTLVDSRYQPPK